MGRVIQMGSKPASLLCLGLLLLLGSSVALAGNQPCSGRKGGIARCDGELFLCRDGSISASKKNCALMFGEPAPSPGRNRCCATPRVAVAALAAFAPGPGAGSTA